MDDPHDDTDVPSGTTDGAQMETTSPPDARYHYERARGTDVINATDRSRVGTVFFF